MHPVPFNQDPHRLRETSEKDLEVALGREVRALRLQRDMTVADLADRAGLSMGMLSKIENGNTSPSLTTLQMLAQALEVPVTALFRRFEEAREAVHVKAGEAVVIEREGTRAGHQYNLLGHLNVNTSGVQMEPYYIRLTSESDVFPTFQHDGVELLYMIEGELVYRHGSNRYHIKPGDSLLFDADTPHGPDELITLPAYFLSIICYAQ